jgi:hypothetical protein
MDLKDCHFFVNKDKAKQGIFAELVVHFNVSASYVCNASGLQLKTVVKDL